ncbi:hypothetical protein BJV78DRAFT_1286531 [Lactifluus subvellereus]|nr:hypothetical protein BJV78DRAFT_1286531 [Lactifluus subvellereus]
MLPSPVTAENSQSFLPRRIRASFFGLVAVGALTPLALLFNLSYSFVFIPYDLFFFPQYPPRFHEWRDKESVGTAVTYAFNAPGRGNAILEVLLNAHPADLTRRTYVFEKYTWDKTVSGDYSIFNGKRIPARVPLTPLLSDAVLGDSKRFTRHLSSFIPSPILTHFSWSPLITAALAANARTIHPALSNSTPADFTPSLPRPSSQRSAGGGHGHHVVLGGLNGFSSMTSNGMVLRAAQGVDWNETRFW